MLTILMKAGTLSLLHVGVAFAVAFALTGSVSIAAGIALIEPGVMSFAVLLHERVWRAVSAAPVSRTDGGCRPSAC